MINLKVLSAAAVMALMLPLASPTESFAQVDKGMGVARGGGGGPPAAGFSGGGRGGGGAPGPRISGGGGGGHYGGYGGGYRRHGGGGGFIPGAVIGGIIGGALASPGYGYYGTPYGYYGPGYYDDGYYDEGVVTVAPGPVGGDAVAYCMQTYRSYDPRSGTYLGYDGYRHPCP